jgi:lipoate synthase
VDGSLLEYTPPPGWRPVEPASVGAHDADLVLLHDSSRTDFTANITVTATEHDSRSIVDVADESVARLAETFTDVVLMRRNDIDDDGVAQVVRLHGAGRDLVQTQVHLLLPEENGGAVVLQLVLTSTPDQLDEVVDDFQSFVAGMRPA